MAGGAGDPSVFGRLALYMKALGAANRVELLRRLQVPLTLGEIQLTPSRQDGAGRSDRPITRQALERHLKALVALGLVHARAASRDGRSVTEYVVNHARLFVLLDELRQLTRIRPLQGATVVTAIGASPSESVRMPRGLGLVVVYGPLEGMVFPLEGEGPWTIGREKGADVVLLHDPFVSKENSRIDRDAAGTSIEALPGARNGTRVNWTPLEVGQRVRLESGDVVGVGRSLLLVRGV